MTHDEDEMIHSLHGSLADWDKMLLTAQLNQDCSESQVERLMQQVQNLEEPESAGGEVFQPRP